MNKEYLWMGPLGGDSTCNHPTHNLLTQSSTVFTVDRKMAVLNSSFHAKIVQFIYVQCAWNWLLMRCMC
jgi:hypothetical protein